MPQKTNENEYVSIKIRRDVSNDVKIVAALNGETIQQWMERKAKQDKRALMGKKA